MQKMKAEQEMDAMAAEDAMAVEDALASKENVLAVASKENSNAEIMAISISIADGGVDAVLATHPKPVKPPSHHVRPDETEMTEARPPGHPLDHLPADFELGIGQDALRVTGYFFAALSQGVRVSLY
jgi:hypothetical protein